jgi:hypothetical protein
MNFAASFPPFLEGHGNFSTAKKGLDFFSNPWYNEKCARPCAGFIQPKGGMIARSFTGY